MAYSMARNDQQCFGFVSRLLVAVGMVCTAVVNDRAGHDRGLFHDNE